MRGGGEAPVTVSIWKKIMTQNLKNRLIEAITRGVQVRSQVYASIKLEDKQLLGPPTSIEDIDLLEKTCGHKLPPSYRAFLGLHNGWRMVDGATDLLSVQEMLVEPIAEEIREWQTFMAEEGETALAEGLVVGFGTIAPSSIVLDFSHVDNNGECKVIDCDKIEFFEYDSFIQWLEDAIIEYEEILNHSGNGDKSQSS